MRLSRRTLVCVALAATLPLALLAACGSNSFSSNDSDAATVTGEGDSSLSSDTSSSQDAGIDTGPTLTWCQMHAPTAIFCADFDEGDLSEAYQYGVLTHMMTPTIGDAGVPGIVLALDDAGLSGPSSMSTVVPVTSFSTTSDSVAILSATPATDVGVKGFIIDFDLRVGVQGNSLGPLLILNLTDGLGHTNEFEVQIQTGQSAFSFGLGTTTVGPFPTVSEWTHYRVVIPLANENVVVTEQGSSPVDVAQNTDSPSFSMTQIQWGQAISNLAPPTGGTQMSYDNVVLAAYNPADAGDGG
jgi:hypothetical protein